MGEAQGRRLFIAAIVIVSAFCTCTALPLIQLDGSGTSNTAPLIWQLCSTWSSRTKPATVVSYRAINTPQAIVEFVGDAVAPKMDFAVGDAPVSPEAWTQLSSSNDSMLHVPVLLAPIAFYHNVPGVGKGVTGLNLSPCTLAGIFSGAITQWEHPGIRADNPNSTVVQALIATRPAINVLRHVNGSSSNWAVLRYLTSASSTCATPWPASSPIGFDSPFLIGTNVSNTQAMVNTLLSTPYSIGYGEVGVAVASGLKEVNILNKAGVWVNTANASFANATLWNATLPSDLAASDWTSVNPVWRDGATQWPLLVISYFYVRTDSSFLEDAGSLLKQFITWILNSEVAGILPLYGFVALPEAVRATFRAGLNSSMVTSGHQWTYEATVLPIVGQGDYVISALRQGYYDRVMQQLVAAGNLTNVTMALGNVYQVHGSGSTAAASYLRYVMHLLTDRSRLPIDMSYRVVGTIEAQEEMLNVADMYSGYNHFRVGEVPLSQRVFKALNGTVGTSGSTGGVVHLPFAVSSVSVFYNQPVPFMSLKLDACLLTKIFSGSVSTWNNSDVASLNGWDGVAGGALLNSPIVVYAYASANSNTQTLYQYLVQSCTAISPFPLTASDVDGLGRTLSWPASVVQTYNDLPIKTPEDMVAAIAGTPHSIGYAQSLVGLAASLDEALLQNAAGTFLTSSVADLSVAVLATDLPVSITSDFSAVSLVARPGAAAWPMTALMYWYSYPLLAPYDKSGPLLVALFNFTLSDEGQALLSSHGLTPLPDLTRLAMQKYLPPTGAVFTVASLLQPWTMEQPGDFSTSGMGLYTFSGNRISFASDHINDMEASIATVQATLEERLPVRVRVAGPSDTLLASIMTSTIGMFWDASTAPLKSTYEMVSSTAAMPSMLVPLQSGRADSAPAHVLIAGQPLSSTTRAMMGQSGLQFLQTPFIVRPVALAYRGPPGLYLSACSVFGILSGAIRTWNDPKLAADNPTVDLPASTITLVYPAATGGDAQAMVAYAVRACPSSGGGSISLAALPEFDARAVGDMVSSGQQWSYLAVIPLAVSSVFNLSQVALAAGQSGQLRLTAAANTSAVYSNQLEAAMSTGASGGVPTDPSGDWSQLNLSTNPDVYPVLRADFIIMPADLSKYAAAGPPLQALFTFLTTYFQTNILPAYSAAFSPIGTLTRQYAGSTVSPRIRIAADVTRWPVVQSSANVTPGTFPVILNRFGQTSVLLEMSTGSQGITLATVQQICSGYVQQAAAPMSTQAADRQSKVDLTYGIAVAAIVMACLLTVTLVVLAAVLMRRRGSLGSPTERSKLPSSFDHPINNPLR